MKAIQFTLFSTTGKYRPISTITKLGEKEKYIRGNKEASNSLIRGNSFKWVKDWDTLK